jgi:hypothetical protein
LTTDEQNKERRNNCQNFSRLNINQISVCFPYLPMEKLWPSPMAKFPTGEATAPPTPRATPTPPVFKKEERLY